VKLSFVWPHGCDAIRFKLLKTLPTSVKRNIAGITKFFCSVFAAASNAVVWLITSGSNVGASMEFHALIMFVAETFGFNW
jgi:hypothetical protein